MTGITEYAMEDIYDYIKRVQIPALAFQKQCRALLLSVVIRSLLLSFLQHEERDFVLKFSAMEIYNEVVRDLLSTDSSPLRLLDDAEVKHWTYGCCIIEFFLMKQQALLVNLLPILLREGLLWRNLQRKL